ncbi:MAG TPA: hypothetical protein VNR00_19085 [Opitutus sp.]|nr:hypothetical protein [Opitutus sp.]
MSNHEAKFLLHAYRPSGRDANDPAMADALAQAQNDPALRAWFQRQQAHDVAVSEKLIALAPPAGLRDAILAGARAGSNARQARPNWKRSILFAIAASIALVLSVTAWWWFAPTPGQTLDQFAVNYVSHGFRLEKRDADVEVLKTWLAQQGGPMPRSIPAELERLQALGCRTVKFDEHSVSLVCFERGGKEYHVFVARRDELPADRSPRGPAMFVSHNHVVASWSDPKNYYVLVTDASREAVEQIL